MTQKLRLLILCEGDTERVYFEELRQTAEVKRRFASVVVLKPKHYHAQGLLSRAINEVVNCDLNPMKLDEVWCVFDRDNKEDLRAIFENASKHGVKIAFSSICFEYWLLLHSGCSSRLYQTCEEVLREIESYKKADVQLLKRFVANVDVACSNARRRRKEFNVEAAQIWERYSYSDVDLLVDVLRGVHN